jgi:hypothetical protein
MSPDSPCPTVVITPCDPPLRVPKTGLGSTIMGKNVVEFLGDVSDADGDGDGAFDCSGQGGGGPRRVVPWV